MGQTDLSSEELAKIDKIHRDSNDGDKSIPSEKEHPDWDEYYNIEDKKLEEAIEEDFFS